MVTIQEDPDLTVAQIAERLHVTPQSVRLWIKHGQLRAWRPGGPKMGWRIRRSELERFRAERGGD